MATTRWLDTLFALPRWQKRIAMLSTDILLLPFAIWLSFALRLGEWQPKLQDGELLMLVAPIITIPIFISLGLYRAVVRFTSGPAFITVLKGVTVSTAMLAMIALLMEWKGIPRSVYPIYWGTAFLLIGGSRYIARKLYHTIQRHPERTNIIIYGAGQSGTHLAVALENSSEYCVAAYVDDNPSLYKTVIHGVKVYPSRELPDLLSKLEIKQVLLAMPSINPIQRKKIVGYLEPLKVHVRTVPSINELVSGKSSITELREIEIDELLGRAPVTPDPQLLSSCIAGKSVMVTGAGGSIGSELCRQIIKLQPTCLVLFEISEFALYQIEQELTQLSHNENINVPLIATLGSVQDKQRIKDIIALYKVETLYHAAAYKHVPMVEHNPIEGVRNNVFGTLHTAQAAQEQGVKHFILISTDKAVRPTNVMGASKRLAELVLQGLAQLPGHTTFGMVRFGNVLGSSGSVVPLFRHQIRHGGPITVTHPDIIRYFMTIPEASQLVIQAGAMATGGDVFLLDMGEPVRIYDMAKRMVHLSGLEIKDNDNPNGDIHIDFTGLRPGEKLYEELLIAENPQKTAHPRVFKAHEQALSWQQLEHMLAKLEIIFQQGNLPQLYNLLRDNVHGFQHSAQWPGAKKIQAIPSNIVLLKNIKDVA